MDNLSAVILAGGSGTRFWPKSTEAKPKQFLNLLEDKTMLQLTVDRMKKIVNLDKIFIVVQEEHKNLVLEQIEGINERNVIIQPSVRNTAPLILMATNYINQIYPGTNIIAIPSDHLINLEDKFLDNINIGNDYINENKKGIVTIGIVPTRAEVGYGYIKLQEDLRMDEVLKIERFVEKPDYEKAVNYISSGNYLWNAGMFLFNSEYLFELYKLYLNNTYSLINSLPKINDIDYLKKLKEYYQMCDNISFDYAIMEKVNNTFVIPSSIGWDDIGTWSSLERYCDKDNLGNITKGDIKIIGSKNNVVYSDEKKVVLLDVDNLFLIETNGVVIVTRKDNMDKVHTLRKMVDYEKSI